MNKLEGTKKWLYNEFVAGRSSFDWAFMALGVGLQILVFSLYPEKPIVVVSGIAGILSVLLGAQGKISNFVFGFIQVTTYLYLSFVAKLYGQVGINVFYFLSMVVAVYSWGKQYRNGNEKEGNSLQTRGLSLKALLLLSIVIVACCFVAGWALKQWSDDPQPYLDAFTTVPAIAAQLMMVFRYRDQWYCWLAIDIFGTIMWIAQGNYCMAAMYAFWCANCLYGFYNWSKEMKHTHSDD